MWDLPNMVLLQKARNALRAGRLDEAYGIATEKKLRDHRQCQLLLEKLVAPLLERARDHLDAGRLEDALADVERAQNVGGNRPATAELREKVVAVLKERRRLDEEQRQAMVSVRGHMKHGRLEEGAARLRDAPLAGEQAAELGHRLDRQRRKAADARARAEKHLGSGDVDEAIAALSELVSLAREEPENQELVRACSRQGEAEIAAALTAGRLERAAVLHRKLEALDASGPERSRWREALDLAEKSARAIAREDWPQGRIYLRRLEGLIPEAAWVAEAEDNLKQVEEALRNLRASPLGRHVSDFRAGTGPSDGTGETLALAPTASSPSVSSGNPAPRPLKARDTGQRFLLWVEGVGTFLLLGSERSTLGRSGSSARPDVALGADIEGVHAEILRVDHDYFLVPRGPTWVGARRVERHLLADGDEVYLGKRCRLTFRLPSKLSPTAVLELGSGLRLDGDVRKVILLDGPLIFGSGGGCHIGLREGNGRVILSAGEDGFRCQAPGPIVIDGKVPSAETPLPLGAQVEAGSLTFTLTAAEHQR